MLNQHPKILHSKYMLIPRMPTTLTSGLLSYAGLDLSHLPLNNLNSYTICIQNSSKTYFSALKTLSKANKTSKSFSSLRYIQRLKWQFEQNPPLP